MQRPRYRFGALTAANAVAAAFAIVLPAIWSTPTLAQQKTAPAKPAAGPRHLGKFGAFDAFVNGEGASKICYIYAKPKASAPKTPERKDAYLTITNRPATKVAGEVSIRFGAKLKEDAAGAEMTVGKDKIKLFTKDDAAWALDAKGDAAIAAAMEKADAMSIKAAQLKGPDLTDSYDLKGFAQARKAINDACK